VKWNPDTMLLNHVMHPFKRHDFSSTLKNAGLKKLARKGKTLILTRWDGVEYLINPGEEIPLPMREEEHGQG